MRLGKPIFYIFSISILVVLVGCYPKPVPRPPLDEYGCNPPPPDVFTKVGIDMHFAQSTFGKIVTGDINIKSNPGIISAASKAVTDVRITTYLRCLALRRDDYTKEQAAYFEQLYAFMRTSPSSEDFLKWQEKNRFPSTANQKRPSMDTIPDVTKAKREVLITSIKQLESGSNLKDVSKYVPGYFELTASPTSSRYSYSRVDTICLCHSPFEISGAER